MTFGAAADGAAGLPQMGPQGRGSWSRGAAADWAGGGGGKLKSSSKASSWVCVKLILVVRERSALGGCAA